MKMGNETTTVMTAKKENYTFPYILVTTLYFLWGFAHSILDVLNKHFQEALGVSRAESGLVQFSVYGAYFLMAIPAGIFMKRYSYKHGILVGLLMYSFGAFLFYPATFIQKFWFVLIALFIIACGLTFLETAANPYVTVLGDKETADRRINFSQAFNSIGWITGPYVGSMLILSEESRISENQFSSLATPYLTIGCVVLIVAFLFYKAHLPEISENVDPHVALSEEDTAPIFQKNSLWEYNHFKWAIFTQFCYVAAQTGIFSFFINYVTETGVVATDQEAGIQLSLFGMGLFMIGRFFGAYLMKFVEASRLLSLYGFVNMLCMLLVILGLGVISYVALLVTFFCMSIMFPTIFSLGIKHLGVFTKQAASYIIAAIIGGALSPILMGYIADKTNMQTGFFIPLLCFGVVTYFGMVGSRYK
ncbi:MAG: L-fucose:H+ symporter permease [Cytophagales bacterium]|nr:L-fucose:H+ symporter permease [Cytophagales bacterium]MDW8383137.1 L-fucose:H+ symporter permease [Flammeovirgaceae bacterium]